MSEKLLPPRSHYTITVRMKIIDQELNEFKGKNKDITAISTAIALV